MPGKRSREALQRFLNLTPWMLMNSVTLSLGYAMENFAELRGVLMADPTGLRGEEGD